jgi:hypothetical protein
MNSVTTAGSRSAGESADFIVFEQKYITFPQISQNVPAREYAQAPIQDHRLNTLFFTATTG